MTEYFSIGVDLGGTNLRAASFAPGVGILDTISVPTRLWAGREQVVQDICEAVESLAGRQYGGRQLAGVAIGTPGPLELPEGILRNPPNLTGWDGFNLRKAIESRLGCQVEVEGDANVAALAESAAGTGQIYGVDSLCMLTLGTGVGSGLVFSGQIWHGSTGMGGEAGHIVVHPRDGAPCGCGGYGCLEQYASATAIVRMARERMGEQAPSSAHEVALLAMDRVLPAEEIFKDVGTALAIALTALINTLNLPLYVLGGGVCEAWDLFAPTMFAELERRSYVYRLTRPTEAPTAHALQRHKTYILSAQLGAQAGLLGACLLAAELRARPMLALEQRRGA